MFAFSAEHLGDAGNGFHDVLARIERGDADVALTALAESGSGRRDNVRFVEELVEEVPAVALDVHPEVGGVGAADHVVAELEKCFLDDLGVFEVEVDDGLGLSLAFGRMDCFRAALSDVAAAVELGGLAARPEGTHLDSLAVSRVSHEFLGNDRVAATDAGEARRLRVAAEFDCTFTRTFALVDRVGDAGRADERLVGGVEKDERLFGSRPIDPFLKLRLGGRCAGGVVGEAEIDDISLEAIRRGNESVLGGTFEIDETFIASIDVCACTAGHDVRIYVHGINRIGDCDFDILTEKLLNVAAVALGAVGNEDLVGGNIDSAILEVGLGDGFTEESVALFRAVAVERLALGDIVDRLVHRFDDGGRKGFRDISDSETDDFRRGIFFLEVLHAVCNFGEEVAGLYL